ncbi:marine proteobacterial sortase target protein [Gammaproteobacteria bacterium 53_120_T64]|nr:marine proteobacterial sortase target protein [Gammaproteobacteria bacterium 53_120_T64]
MNAGLACSGISHRLQRRVSTHQCFLLALLLFSVCISASASASAEVGGDDDEIGLLGSAVLALHFSDGGAEVMAPQLSSRVDIHITGPIARVRLAQTFSNPSDAWAEAVYTFPLPPDSAVDHLQMRIGERIIEGEIQERETAQQIYQQARQAGQQAALVERQRPNIFRTHIANVAPGEELTVVLEYQQQVMRRGSRFSLHYPMSITPRYAPENRLAGADAGTASQLATALLDETHNATEIWVDLQAGFELDEIESRYHPVSKHRLDDSHWQLRLDPQTHRANADFVIEWQGRELAVPQVHVFTQDFSGHEYALLQVMPPQIELEQYRQPRDIVYVIDTSGSMGGESLRQAKRALLWAIGRLDDRDRFNIIEFNSEAWSLFDTERQTSATNIAKARRFVQNLEARGGTEMRKALDIALCGACANNDNSGRLRQVLFLTDGAISNEAELLSAISRQLGNSRLFTVGIGSAPNRYFMRKAAKMGRGSFVNIGKVSEVEGKITELFERIDVPVMSDIELQINADHIDISTAFIPDLYASEPLVVAIKADNLPESIILGGRRQGDVWQQRVALDVAAEGSGIHIAWARKKLASLLDERALQSDVDTRLALRSEVLDIALQHHLVTPFTSLVAVDKTPLRPVVEELEKHIIKNNAAKGRRFSLARTATGLSYFIGLGNGLLLLAVCFFWLSRQRSQSC